MGRLDGRISRASETSLLPAPTSNFAQLQQRFNQLNLSVKDLVTLSGTYYDIDTISTHINAPLITVPIALTGRYILILGCHDQYLSNVFTLV